LARGYLTEAIVNYVALLGWSPGGERELYTIRELAEIFEISGISKSPAIFDLEKLTHFNSEYIRSMPPENFAALAEPYIRQAVKNPGIDAAEIARLLQPRTEVLTDIPPKLDFLDELPDYGTELFTNKKSKTDGPVSLAMLQKVLPALEGLCDWTEESVKNTLTALAESLGVKNATLMWPVRIAMSGRAVTPGGAVELCLLLGREETLRRLRMGIKKLS
jgi:glutamyl-tRNA synthetase